MNATVETEPDVAFAQAAAPLLKEYTAKLKELATEASNYLPMPASNPVRDELIGRFKFLKPPIEELVRQVSSVVNQGSLNGLEKVELWLRLAELEHNLETASRRIETIKPKK